MQIARLLLILALCLGPVLAQSAVEWVEKAQLAEDAGNFSEAGEAWEMAAQELGRDGNAPYRARALFYSGLAHYKGGAREAALAQLTLGVEAFLALGEGEGQSLCLLQRGVVEIELARWLDAERSFRSALEVARGVGNEARALEATEFLGKTLEAGRRWPEATELTEGLVEAYRSRAPEKVPELLSTLGALYQLQSQLEKAESCYAEAATLHLEQGKNQEALAARRDLARFYLKSRQWSKAEDLMSELLPAVGLNDPSLPLDHAYALAELGRHQEALASLEAQLKHSRDPKLLSVLRIRRLQALVALKREAEALRYLSGPDFGSDKARAEAAESMGRRDLAEDYLRKVLATASAEERPSLANALALKLVRWDRVSEAADLLQKTLADLPAGDRRRAVLMANLGETFLSRGQPAQALPIYQEVLAMTRRGEGEADLSVVLTNLGATYEYLGDYSQALRHLEEAVQVGERYQKAGSTQGTIYNALGLIYVKLGRFPEGLAFYQRALAYHRGQANSYGETASLINIGAVYKEMEDSARAASHFNQALTIAEREGRIAQQIAILNDLGQLHTGEQAEAYYQRALELEKTAPNALTRQIVLSNLADTWYGLGRSEEAEKLAIDVSEELKRLGAKENELLVRRILLLGSLENPDPQLTRAHLDRALDLSADIVTGLSSGSARSFVGEHETVLRKGLNRILRDGQLDAAFSVDERLRSLGLAALTNGLPLQSAHVPAELAEREQTLLSRMREAANRSIDLSTLRAEHRLLREQIERHHLAAGALRSMEPAAMAQIQRHLATDEVMLSYLLAGPDLWVLAITSDGLQGRRVGALEELEPLITTAFRRASSFTRQQQTEQALAELSAALWLPAQELVAGKLRVILVPAGPLYSVPFAALTQDGQPLAERYRLTQCSSATAWLLSRRSEGDGKGALVAALGNFSPTWSEGGFGKAGVRSAALVPLPGTLQEMERIAAALSGLLALKEHAMTGDALRQGSAGRRQLHYATHGLLNRDEPMLSGLVASDRLVTAMEIFNWALDADLAVLSACHSGNVSQGLEYVSLTRAFQFAGVRTLLATNWAVDDQTTAEWMEAFYEALRENLPADEAAHRACLAVRKKHPHPYFWAPFALWGDGTVAPRT